MLLSLYIVYIYSKKRNKYKYKNKYIKHLLTKEKTANDLLIGTQSIVCKWGKYYLIAAVQAIS